MNEKHDPWILALFSTLIFFLANWNVIGPFVQGDEGGYLANAATLAGYRIDSASSYHAGYSLLITPAFLIGGDPYIVFAFVKLFNSVMWGITILLVYAVLKISFKDAGRWKLLGATTLAMLYPAWVTMNGYAMSESGFVLLYTLSVFLAFRVVRSGQYYWLLWAFSIGYLYTIHPKALPIIGAGFIASILIAKARRDWFWFLGFCLIIVGMVLVYSKIFEPWLIKTMTTGEFPARLNYQPLSQRYLLTLESADKLKKLMILLAGHIMYIFIATFGVVVYPFIFAATNFFQDRNYRKVGYFVRGDNLVLIYMGLTLIGTLFLSALNFSAVESNNMRLDHWIYGRYSEAVILPLLAIGFLQASNRTTFRISLVLTVFAGLCSFVVLEGMGKPINTALLNVPAFWAKFYSSNESSILLWLLGTIPLILLFSMTKSRFRILIVAGLFVFSSVLQLNWHVEAANGIRNRQDIAYYIRKTVSPESCVGFDNNYEKSPWLDTFLRQYQFYLYDYDYKRMDINDWYSSCNGPLISFSKDIGSDFNDVIPVAFERADGPLLWVKSSAISFDEFIQKKIVVSPESLATRVSLGSGWNNIETSYVWSTEQAEIILPVPLNCRNEYDCGLRMIFNVFNASQEAPKTVIVEVNGIQAAEWVITSSQVQERMVPIRRDVLNANDRKVNVIIRVPGAASPASLGLSDDARVLGVGLQELEFVIGN
jgi:hypothetical protein